MNLMATVGSAAYFVTASATTMAGWLSDRFIAPAHTHARPQDLHGSGVGRATIIVAVAWVSNPVASMVFLMLGCSRTAYSHPALAITQTSPARAAGRWSGLQNFVGTWPGWLRPPSRIRGGQDRRVLWAFAVSAGVALAGSMVYLFLLGPVEPWCGAV